MVMAAGVTAEVDLVMVWEVALTSEAKVAVLAVMAPVLKVPVEEEAPRTE